MYPIYIYICPMYLICPDSGPILGRRDMLNIKQMTLDMNWMALRA